MKQLFLTTHRCSNFVPVQFKLLIIFILIGNMGFGQIDPVDPPVDTIPTFPFPLCDIFEDYSDNTGWNQVGTDVVITGGQVEFQNGAADGNCTQQRRVHRTVTITDLWSATCEFFPEGVGDIDNDSFTGHIVLALTAGTSEPVTGTTVCGSGPGNQDGIWVSYITENPPNGDIFFLIGANEGGNVMQSTRIIANTLGVTYYPVLERISCDSVRLSVFTDVDRTIELPDSPVTLSGISANIQTLTTVQHGNILQGDSDRELWGWIDNLCIVSNGACCDNTIPNVRITAHSGDIYVNEPCYGLIMKSPDGNCWRTTIDNNGQTIVDPVTCP